MLQWQSVRGLCPVALLGRAVNQSIYTSLGDSSGSSGESTDIDWGNSESARFE